MNSFSTKTLCAVLALSANAATYTVCASGCSYTTVQAAVTAASRGDFIDVRAEETFEEKITLLRKTGSGVVTIRTSRWAELPPDGTRVTSAHTALMPQLQPPSATDPVITTGEAEANVSSVSTGADTITFTGDPDWSNGQPIACWAYNGTSPVVIPSPMVENQVYYVLNEAGATMQLSNAPLGAAINFTTSTISATHFRCSLALAVSGYKFIGLNIQKKALQDTQNNLIEVGTGACASRFCIPGGISFEHSWIHGLYQENGPKICLLLNVGAFSITDSTIENCNKEGEEGKALGGFQAVGPITIRNNYIAAGSINMIFGGDFARIEGLVNGDTGGIQVSGNYFTRPFWVKYLTGTSGAGAPVGACADGVYYLNSSNGVLYTCTSSAWGLAPVPADGEYYRSSSVAQNCASGACWQALSGVYVTSSYYRAQNYFTKNLFEMKSVANMATSGNVFENNWNNAEQEGYAVWPCSLTQQGDAQTWATCRDSQFLRNIIKVSTNGIRIAKYNGPNPATLNINRYTIQDNLLFKISNTGYPSIDTIRSQLNYFGGFCDDCLFDHNTSNTVTNTVGGAGIQYDTGPMTRFRYSNSISMNEGNGLVYDTPPCTAALPSPSGHFNSVMLAASAFNLPSCNTNMNGADIATTTMFTSSTDFRLQATSPYSAKCTGGGCQYFGTDGKDLGADIDQIDAATQGAVSGTPWLGGSVTVTAGSTRAIVRYTAPTSAACNLTLYNDIGRSVENIDTNTGGEKLDSRTGNVSNGRDRQFVLGTNTPLAPSTLYWAVTDCAGQIGFTPVRTVASGSGFNWTTSFSSTTTGNYSSSADMSSPTSTCTGSTCTVPIPANSVRYFQATGGLITAGVAP